MTRNRTFWIIITTTILALACIVAFIFWPESSQNPRTPDHHETNQSKTASFKEYWWDEGSSVYLGQWGESVLYDDDPSNNLWIDNATEIYAELSPEECLDMLLQRAQTNVLIGVELCAGADYIFGGHSFLDGFVDEDPNESLKAAVRNMADGEWSDYLARIEALATMVKDTTTVSKCSSDNLPDGLTIYNQFYANRYTAGFNGGYVDLIVYEAPPEKDTGDFLIIEPSNPKIDGKILVIDLDCLNLCNVDKILPHIKVEPYPGNPVTPDVPDTPTNPGGSGDNPNTPDEPDTTDTSAQKDPTGGTQGSSVTAGSGATSQTASPTVTGESSSDYDDYSTYQREMAKKKAAEKEAKEHREEASAPSSTEDGNDSSDDDTIIFESDDPVAAPDNPPPVETGANGAGEEEPNEGFELPSFLGG